MKKRFCYYISPSQNPETHGGYVPSLVNENEAGYSPMLGNGAGARPWVWGKTLPEAEAVCAKANADLGLSDRDVTVIIASSMRVGRL